MSPESGMVEQIRFELNGHLVVAYLPYGRRRSDAAPIVPQPPARWLIKIDEGSEFPGPFYRGFVRGDEREVESELRRYLESDPRLS